MQAALKVTPRVLPGNRAEIVAPELTDGEAVEVFVVMPNTLDPPAPAATMASLMEFLDSLPPGPCSAPT